MPIEVELVRMLIRETNCVPVETIEKPNTACEVEFAGNGEAATPLAPELSEAMVKKESVTVAVGLLPIL